LNFPLATVSFPFVGANIQPPPPSQAYTRLASSAIRQGKVLENSFHFCFSRHVEENLYPASFSTLQLAISSVPVGVFWRGIDYYCRHDQFRFFWSPPYTLPLGSRRNSILLKELLRPLEAPIFRLPDLLGPPSLILFRRE